MFFDMSPWELIAIALVGLMVFGPDRLPKLAADAARLLRELRRMATGAKQELQDSLGPELADLDLADLNPRTFVKRNLLDPIDDEVADLKRTVNGNGNGNGPGGRGTAAARGSESTEFDADTT